MSRTTGSARRKSVSLHASVSAIVRDVFDEIQERNLSITSVARGAGVPRESLYRWAKGFSPRLSEIEDVLAVLGRALYVRDSDYERRLSDAALRACRPTNPMGKRIPTVSDMSDEEFLKYMLSCAQEGVYVSAAQVNRLKALAKYAETQHPAPGWWGTIDETETAKAVGRARAYLAKGQVKC